MFLLSLYAVLPLSFRSKYQFGFFCVTCVILPKAVGIYMAYIKSRRIQDILKTKIIMSLFLKTAAALLLATVTQLLACLYFLWPVNVMVLD